MPRPAAGERAGLHGVLQEHCDRHRPDAEAAQPTRQVWSLGSSRQAISQHLEVLEAAGLVETRREGRYKLHDLNTRPLEHLVDRWLHGTKEEAR
jgi:DNA-binding transcriptional ArsR family regulator